MSIAEALDTHDGLGLAALVRAQKISAEEVLTETLRRVDAVNPTLNAVVTRMDAAAHRRLADGVGDGPFAGVPFLLKDMHQPYPGYPLSWGSAAYAKTIQEDMGALARRHEAAGLVIVGKSNTPEFGLVPYTEPVLFGPCRNPWNPAHTPGGSSGGAAAAVAGGLVPMAHASDGGGSIRVPASCCNLFGLRPTRGRNPTGPLPQDGIGGLATEHAVTRSVRDSAALLDATHGADPGMPYRVPAPAESFLAATERDPAPLKVGLMIDPWMGPGVLDRDVRAAVEDTAKLLEELGHRVEVPRLPAGLDLNGLADAFLVLWAAETAHFVLGAEAYLHRKAGRGEFEATTWALARIGDSYSAGDAAKALARIGLASRGLAHMMQHWDVLLSPTLTRPPPAVGALRPTPVEHALLKLIGFVPFGPLLRLLLDRMAAKSFDWLGYTPIANMMGLPAMSVPLAMAPSGLPIGSHFMARFGAEATLFGLAAQLERARPWAARRPSVWAGLDTPNLQ